MSDLAATILALAVAPEAAPRHLRERVAAADRAEVVDVLRRRTLRLVRTALERAGHWQGAIPGRRHYDVGPRAVAAAAALIQLNGDFSAKHYHASALLAARRYTDCCRELVVLEAEASTRLQRDVARLARSIALSYCGAWAEGLALAKQTGRSPFHVIASNAALTLVVQSAQRGALNDLSWGLDLCDDTFGPDAWRVLARLLSNYADGGDPSAAGRIRGALLSAGEQGRGVASQLEVVLASCSR